MGEYAGFKWKRGETQLIREGNINLKTNGQKGKINFKMTRKKVRRPESEFELVKVN